MSRRLPASFKSTPMPGSSKSSRLAAKKAVRDLIGGVPVSRRKAIRREVERAVSTKIEHKFYDTALNVTFMSNTWGGAELDPAGGLNCLNGIPVGTAPNERVGRRVIIDSVFVKGYVAQDRVVDQADSPATTQFMLALVLDTQTNAAQLNAEDVYVAGTVQTSSFRNLLYSDRFIVLDTFEGVSNPTVSMQDSLVAATSSVAFEAVRFHMKSSKPITIQFKSSNGNITDVVDNSLHVIGISSTTDTVIAYEARVRFRDA